MRKQIFAPLGRTFPLIFWLALLAGLIVRLTVVWQPVPELIARFNADDAYYYLTIAHNLAMGHGASFDGIAPTNGFHPLYLALIVPLFWIAPDPEFPVHVAFTILMVFNVLTVIPLYGMLKDISNRSAALIGVIAWLFNPVVLLIAGEGVESSISTFFVASVAFLYLRLRQSYARPPLMRFASLGIFFGLTILARTDGVFLVATIAVDVAMRHMRGSRAEIRAWLICLGACFVILAPWLAWNMLMFGTLAQVSGAAIFYESHFGHSTLMQAATAAWQSLGRAFQMVEGTAFQLFPLPFFGLAAWLIMCFRGQHVVLSRPSIKRVMPVSFLFLFAVGTFIFYGGILLHLQSWYFLPIVFALTVGLGIGWYWITELLESSAMLRRDLTIAQGLILVMAFCLFGWVWQSRNLGLYVAQGDGYRIAEWLTRETEPGARVGAWNSGIIGYFANRTVIDLDGVVNNQIYAYVTRRQITFDLHDVLDYARVNRIDYLTDYDNILPSPEAPEFGGVLQEVYAFPSAYDGYTVRVYRVMPVLASGTVRGRR